MSYKVALFGPKNWALGSINLQLKKYLGRAGHNVKNVDWGNIDNVQAAIDWCDMFITEVHVFERLGQHLPDHLKKKGMYVWHHLSEIPGFSLKEEPNGHFTTKIPVDTSLVNNFYAITKDTKESADSFYGLDVGLLPVGTDDEFWNKRTEFGPIKKIGCVMSPENQRTQYTSVKRYDMFSEIGEKAGVDYDYCFGKTIHTGSYIYKGFDLIVNTSTHEGLPTPLLECSAAKVPFISTKVGIVPQYSSIKTFDTVDEAVEIIKELNSDPKILKKYVEDVYDDVAMNNLWQDHVSNYYNPAFDRVANDVQYPHLVVSRYNEDVSWLNELGLSYTIYNKGEDNLELDCIKRENVGRETETFLHHIIENYDTMEGSLCFAQGNPFDHLEKEPMFHLIKNFNQGFLPLGRPERSLGDGRVWHEGLPVAETAEKLGVKRDDDSYFFAPGAQFVVSCEVIKKKPLSFWKNAYDVMMSDLSTSPWAFERLWFSMLTDNV